MKKLFIAVLLLAGFSSYGQTYNAPKLATYQKNDTEKPANNSVNKKAPVMASGQMSNASENGKPTTNNKAVLAAGSRKPKQTKGVIQN